MSRSVCEAVVRHSGEGEEVWERTFVLRYYETLYSRIVGEKLMCSTVQHLSPYSLSLSRHPSSYKWSTHEGLTAKVLSH